MTDTTIGTTPLTAEQIREFVIAGHGNLEAAVSYTHLTLPTSDLV